MSEAAPPALVVQSLDKVFRVPRAKAEDDPRRSHLSRRHDRFHALRDLSFTVQPGETFGLVGPNGSGKSTLLKILAGVMHPTSGGFEARGRIGALLELGAGFHPDLTGIENIYLAGALLGFSPRDIDRLLPDIIGFAELERFMDMPVKHYSSGMIARLGFSVATRLAPEILLMDETFATGDARFQARAVEHVTGMKAQGHTLLLVSHNMDVLLALCDRVLWLDRGRLRTLGPAHEVLARYRRSHGHGLEEVERARAVLGPEGLFEPLATDPPVRIASAEFIGETALPSGATIRLALELDHATPPPAPTFAELTWVRAGRLHAQSRVALPPLAGPGTRVVLRFDDCLLTEGEWHCSLAIVSPPPEPVYYDRRIDFGAIRVVTPNPIELDAPMAIPARWRVEAIP